MTDHTLHFTQGEAAVGAFPEYGKLQLVPSPNIVNIDMMSTLESSISNLHQYLANMKWSCPPRLKLVSCAAKIPAS